MVVHNNARENMRVTLKVSAICAATSCLGALTGHFLGGATGALLAVYLTSGPFKPIREIVRNDIQRQLDFNPLDLVTLVPLLMSGSTLQAPATRAIINFVTNEIALRIA